MPLLTQLTDLARRGPATARAVLRDLDDTVRAHGAAGAPRALLRQLDASYRAHGVAGTTRALARYLGDAGRAPAPAPAPAPVPASPPPEPAPRAVSWELRSQAELVDHLERHYHAGVRRALPALLAGARQVEREHAGHPAVPAGLHDRLSSLASELEGHMQREEAVLFPALRTGVRGGRDLDMPMRMMERDHDTHADQLDELRALTGGWTPPPDAPAAWRELYAALAAFAAELREHVYLENNILFARATGERG